LLVVISYYPINLICGNLKLKVFNIALLIKELCVEGPFGFLTLALISSINGHITIIISKADKAPHTFALFCFLSLGSLVAAFCDLAHNIIPIKTIIATGIKAIKIPLITVSEKSPKKLKLLSFIFIFFLLCTCAHICSFNVHMYVCVLCFIIFVIKKLIETKQSIQLLVYLLVS